MLHKTTILTREFESSKQPSSHILGNNHKRIESPYSNITVSRQRKRRPIFKFVKQNMRKIELKSREENGLSTSTLSSTLSWEYDPPNEKDDVTEGEGISRHNGEDRYSDLVNEFVEISKLCKTVEFKVF